MQIPLVEIVSVEEAKDLPAIMRRLEHGVVGKGTRLIGISVWDRTWFGRVKTVAVHYLTNIEDRS